MKKSRNRRRRIRKLTTKDIIKCEFFMIMGKKIKANKVELKFQRDNKTIGSVAFIEDNPHKQTVIRWHDHRYYALRFGDKEAKLLNMTLAKWKTINNG